MIADGESIHGSSRGGGGRGGGGEGPLQSMSSDGRSSAGSQEYPVSTALKLSTPHTHTHTQLLSYMCMPSLDSPPPPRLHLVCGDNSISCAVPPFYYGVFFLPSAPMLMCTYACFFSFLNVVLSRGGLSVQEDGIGMVDEKPGWTSDRLDSTLKMPKVRPASVPCVPCRA